MPDNIKVIKTYIHSLYFVSTDGNQIPEEALEEIKKILQPHLSRLQLRGVRCEWISTDTYINKD